jgi:hypothetical protein
VNLLGVSEMKIDLLFSYPVAIGYSGQLAQLFLA